MEYSVPGAAALSRHDLIELEPLLCRALARVISFSSHGIYFPREASPAEPIWLPKERKLLIPLAPSGTEAREEPDQALGVFMAGGVSGKGMRRLLPSLPGIVDLCLENLGLRKSVGLDVLTGLAARETLLARIVRELEQMRAQLSENDDGFRGNSPSARQGCMAVMVLRCADTERVRTRCGYAFVDLLRRNLAHALAAEAPYQIPLFRCAEDEFALLLREAAAKTACERAGAALLRRLEKFSCRHPATRRDFSLRLSMGYAVYPQDIDGEYFLQSFSEQAAFMLEKARLAARAADECFPDEAKPERRIMGYSRILHEGGVILESLPFSRARVNLGRDAGARPGLRFAVLPSARDAQEPGCKGEVTLLEVNADSSLAQLSFPDGPDGPDNAPEAGDRLRLNAESAGEICDLSRGGTLLSAPAAREEDAAGLLPDIRSFRERLFSAKESEFCLALLRITREGEREKEEGDSRARLAEICRARVAAAFAARYGTRSLIFFHAGMNAEQTAPQYGGILREAAAARIRAAAGLASYPCLHFRREEIVEHCSKALELAEMLPEPRVGVFGSLALNVSADKHYSRGDLFRAVQEYEWALLADKNNADAWNSLGFCMAALSRHTEAQRCFSEALRRAPEDALVLYNLGMTALRLGKERVAARRFRECVKYDPAHAFAHIRLGQLAMKAGRFASAQRSFARAAEDGKGAGTAHRLLARLALRRGRAQQAREYLHEALLHNPQDALALCMLAGLYLDAGEDSSLAEMLARQSLLLMPELDAAKRELARALATRDKGAPPGRAKASSPGS
jgi:tetratricopeptide (TPR) repeat protein